MIYIMYRRPQKTTCLFPEDSRLVQCEDPYDFAHASCFFCRQELKGLQRIYAALHPLHYSRCEAPVAMCTLKKL